MILRACLVLFTLSLFTASADEWFGRAWNPPRTAYPFSLTGPDGQPVQLEDLRGDVLLVAFGFTNCPGICPAIVSQLAAAAKEAGNGVRVVFISVDPDRDTPGRMREFTGEFDGPVLGLTGTRADLAAAAKGFRITARETGDASNFIDHTTDATVVDSKGRVRLTYRFDQLGEKAAIASDLRRLLAEDSLDPKGQSAPKSGIR